MKELNHWKNFQIDLTQNYSTRKNITVLLQKKEAKQIVSDDIKFSYKYVQMSGLTKRFQFCHQTAFIVIPQN